jgi:hypothetical protein
MTLLATSYSGPKFLVEPDGWEEPDWVYRLDPQ